MSEKTEKRIFCVKCGKSYTRKAAFDKHFELMEVRRSEESIVLIPNPCFESQTRQSALSLNEVKVLRSQPTILSKFPTKSKAVEKEIVSEDDENEMINELDETPMSSNTQKKTKG